MDDHFWPSIYPGIVVGLLIGLSAGSIVTTVVGAIGGLAGAVLFFALFEWLGVPPGILQLLGLIAGAVLGSKLLVAAVQRMTRPSARETT